MKGLKWLFELSKTHHIVGSPVRLSDSQIEAISEAFLALEQAKVSAEHERDCHMDIADYFKAQCKELGVQLAQYVERFEAEAERADRNHEKLAELEKQGPVAYEVQLCWNKNGIENSGTIEFRKTPPSPDESHGLKILPLFTRPAPAADLAELVPTVCDGKEQEAFEEYARAKGLDLSQHPLHYLFLDGKTNQARSAWRECLVYVRAAILRNIEEAK